MLLPHLLSLYLLIVSVAVVDCTVQIRTLNGSPYSRMAELLCFAVCFYIMGYAMELNASSREDILLWDQIEYIGIPFVSALWLATSLLYTGYFSRWRPLLFFLIFSVPIASFFLRLTNDLHHFYLASTEFVAYDHTLFLVKHAGPWMYVQSVHSGLMVIAAMGVFIIDSVRREEKPAGKLLLVMGASVFALMGLGLSLLLRSGLPIDWMALCLPLACGMVIWAILRYDLLETKAIARSRAFEAGSDAVLLVNRRNVVLDYNTSARRLCERLHVRLNNRPLTEIFAGWPELLSALESEKEAVIRLMADGENRYYAVASESIDSGSDVRGWIKTVRNVTEIYLLNAELRRQATTDELSVLTNRRAFMELGRERVARAESRGETLFLLMMDLDHFKDVNDRYGHPTGDLVIRDFAGLLRKHFGGDSVVARLGGEEFAVLVDDTPAEELDRRVEAFRTDAAEHVYAYFGKRFHVTVSIGRTRREPGQPLESMMSRADRALYRAKNGGRNCATTG